MTGVAVRRSDSDTEGRACEDTGKEGRSGATGRSLRTQRCPPLGLGLQVSRTAGYCADFLMCKSSGVWRLNKLQRPEQMTANPQGHPWAHVVTGVFGVDSLPTLGSWGFLFSLSHWLDVAAVLCHSLSFFLMTHLISGLSHLFPIPPAGCEPGSLHPVSSTSAPPLQPSAPMESSTTISHPAPGELTAFWAALTQAALQGGQRTGRARPWLQGNGD